MCPQVHSIMRHVADLTSQNLEVRNSAGLPGHRLNFSTSISTAPCPPLQELYKAVAWPLYRIYGHAFEAFKTMVMDDGAAVFRRLEEEHKGALPPVVTPEVTTFYSIVKCIVPHHLCTSGVTEVDLKKSQHYWMCPMQHPTHPMGAGERLTTKEHQAPHDPAASQDSCRCGAYMLPI